MARTSPTCAYVDDRLGLPTDTAPQAGRREKKESQDRHHSRVYRQSGRPSLSASPNLQIRLALIADTVAPTHHLKICQSSVRVWTQLTQHLIAKRCSMARKF